MAFQNLSKKCLINPKKLKKIAICISIFSRYEGASRSAENQAKELSERGYSVTIFTFFSNISSDDFKINIIKPVIPINDNFLNLIYRGLFPFNVIDLVRFIPKFKDFDFIIIHHNTFSILSYFAQKIYGTKVIFYNHHIADGFESNKEFFFKNIYLKCVTPIHWNIIRQFDQVVSVSLYSKNCLFQKTCLESVVIYNRIDYNRFSNNLDKNIVRERYRIFDSPLILFVGRVLPHKGVHILIDAFKIVKKTKSLTRS
ncbi:glycosyltransferase family 4 protein [Methanosarcina horonobensis]|uniref:glycosyltransferase family 4 protein n=1 Tax=Methanosarcina horonobensis TaxID=418008 RepID=UPI00373FD580